MNVRLHVFHWNLKTTQPPAPFGLNASLQKVWDFTVGQPSQMQQECPSKSVSPLDLTLEMGH